MEVDRNVVPEFRSRFGVNDCKKLKFICSYIVRSSVLQRSLLGKYLLLKSAEALWMYSVERDSI